VVKTEATDSEEERSSFVYFIELFKKDTEIEELKDRLK